MTNEKDDSLTAEDIKEALKEALALKRVKSSGYVNGEPTYKLTAKGVVGTAAQIISLMVTNADNNRRGFTASEKRQIISHIETMLKALREE